MPIAARMPMMATTMSSSMRVKPRWRNTPVSVRDLGKTTKGGARTAPPFWEGCLPERDAGGIHDARTTRAAGHVRVIGRADDAAVIAAEGANSGLVRGGRLRLVAEDVDRGVGRSPGVGGDG